MTGRKDADAAIAAACDRLAESTKELHDDHGPQEAHRHPTEASGLRHRREKRPVHSSLLQGGKLYLRRGIDNVQTRALDPSSRPCMNTAPVGLPKTLQFLVAGAERTHRTDTPRRNIAIMASRTADAMPGTGLVALRALSLALPAVFWTAPFALSIFPFSLHLLLPVAFADGVP